MVAKISFIVHLRHELNNDGKFHEVGKSARLIIRITDKVIFLKEFEGGTVLSKDRGLWSVRRLKLQNIMAAVR